MRPSAAAILEKAFRSTVVEDGEKTTSSKSEKDYVKEALKKQEKIHGFSLPDIENWVPLNKSKAWFSSYNMEPGAMELPFYPTSYVYSPVVMIKTPSEQKGFYKRGVKKYENILRKGGEIPPVTIVWRSYPNHGGALEYSDGNHRAEAAFNLGIKKIPAVFAVHKNLLGLPVTESGEPSSPDVAMVQKILDDKTLPAVAEDGMAYIVHWADGRGMFAVRKKSDLMPWLKKTGEMAEIVSIKYGKPEHKGKKLRISENTEEVPPADYRGQHQAATKEGNAPLFDVTMEGIYPKDFYGPEGLRYYANDDTFSYSIIRRAYKRPNISVIVYRAVPKEVKAINRGDWVTLRKDYAKEHGESNLGGKGKYRILQKRVHARDLFTSGDSIDEWGYDPQPEDPVEVRKSRARSELEYINRMARGEKIIMHNKDPGDRHYGKDDPAYFEGLRKAHAEKYKDLNYRIESAEANFEKSLILEAAFTADQMDLDKTYATFKASYEKQTGKAWDKSKFLERIQDWTLYGDQDGFVAARQQASGPIKLVGAAGNPIGVKKGFQEVLATGKPVWGAMDLRLATLAARLGMKMPPAWVMVKVLGAIKDRFAQASGVAPEALQVNKDGSVTITYPDVGAATKFIVGNKAYFEWLLKSQGAAIPAVLRTAISYFLTTGKPPPQPVENDEKTNF